MTPYIVRCLYTVILRPILLGVVAWWPAFLKRTVTFQLARGSLCTSPGEALDSILHILPID